MMDSPRYARALLLFAVLGVFFALDIGAILHAGCFEHDGRILPALVFLVPVATSIAGLTIAWSAARRTGRAFAAAVALILLVATATGATVGVMWWPPQGVVLGASNGFGFGVAALIVLLPFWSALSNQARRDSLLDWGDQLVSWVLLGATIALSAAGTLPRWNRYPTCEADATGSAVISVIGACMAVLALALLVAHRRRVTRLLAFTSPCNVTGGRFDLGVGDGRVEVFSSGPTAYRDAMTCTASIHGDAALAKRALAQRMRFALASAALGIAAAFFAVVLRG